jgi:hypothetical protein
MKLAELQPVWLRMIDARRSQFVGSIEDAQGIRFLCPKCFKSNDGIVGTHSVICWSRTRGVPDDCVPGPGRWSLNGTGFDDLTLDGEDASNSILLSGSGCGWHGFIKNGVVTDA